MKTSWLKRGWKMLRRDRLRCGVVGEGAPAAAVPGFEDALPRRRTLALARALDEATRCHATERAERIIQIAVRRGVDDPRVLAAMARHRLSEGQPEAALRIIESAPHRTAELRVLRAAILIELGRGVEAHADLHRWSQDVTMPDRARLLLANLAWSTGGAEHAARSLTRQNEAQSIPVAVLRILAGIATNAPSERRSADAATLHAVSRTTTEAKFAEAMLRCLGLAVAEGALQPAAVQVEQLGDELALAPDALPLIVAAQELQPRPFEVRLLIGAIEHALPRFSDAAAALEALARLSLLINDTGAAGHWANLAVEVKPMSASLALLVSELEGNTRPDLTIEEGARADETPVSGRRAA